MTDDERPQEQISDIAHLLRERLSIGGRSLREQMRRARRHLPRYLRAPAEVLSEAESLASHPKMRLLVDHERVAHAHDLLRAYLIGVNVTERRKGWFLGALGSLVFNLILFFSLLAFFLKWQNLI